MIEVRELATGEEWAMVRLARAMHDESPHYSAYPFVDGVLVEWCKLCITDDNWLCLVAWDGDLPIGFIAIGSVPMLFSTERTVDDLGLFVLPARRGSSAALRLYKTAEPWARTKGREMRMGITTGTNPEQAASFFTRLGFEQTGILLTKKFT